MIRTKKVIVPIKGRGICPKEDSSLRKEIERCNEQRCIGDEVCVASQDLILALDSSGSIKESGWDVLRDFAVELTKKYQTQSRNSDAMRVGVVLFGNGKLLEKPDGTVTVSPALRALDLTDDLESVRTTISGLEWQRGFTNMAQAFSMGYTMLSSSSARAYAQSAILVLSDGLPSFKYQTEEKANELKDSSIMIYMAPISVVREELEDLKRWASPPWTTNYERIDGFAALQYSQEAFANSLLVKFCPDAYSPSLATQKEDLGGFLMVKEHGEPTDECVGAWGPSSKQASAQGCAEATKAAGLRAFVYSGAAPTAGDCRALRMDLKPGYWEALQANRVNPECPGGGWQSNPTYDTYVVKYSELDEPVQ